MSALSVLVTGGAGFIGASLALELAARDPDWKLTSFEDLHRRAGDVRIYVSDCHALARFTDWRPTHSPVEILEDVDPWIHDHESALRGGLLS